MYNIHIEVLLVVQRQLHSQIFVTEFKFDNGQCSQGENNIESVRFIVVISLPRHVLFYLLLHFDQKSKNLQANLHVIIVFSTAFEDDFLQYLVSSE
jgi:hypothetical protein